jgi:general secretion pathway protein K
MAVCCPNHKRRQAGIALVLVLWVISLLTIMGGSFALSMRREASIVAAEKDNAQAISMAESGVAIAELMLLNTTTNQGWRTDGSIYEITYPNVTDTGGWKIRIRLFSESGKVDLNTADEKLLQNLIRNTPLEPEEQAKLVGAMIDWRDADDLTHLNGAEQKDYEKAGLQYQPTNKPFQSLEELQLVMGMDENIYQQLEPLITVNSGLPQVDFQKASPEVLASIAILDSGLIDDYVAARLDSARNDQPPPAFPGSLVAAGGTTRAETVTVLSEAVLIDDLQETGDDWGKGAAVSVLVEQAGAGGQSPFTILKWQRNTTTDASLFSAAMNDFLVKQYAEYKFNN